MGGNEEIVGGYEFVYVYEFVHVLDVVNVDAEILRVIRLFVVALHDVMISLQLDTLERRDWPLYRGATGHSSVARILLDWDEEDC